MSTGQITWTIEGTDSVTSYTYSPLTSGTWNLGVVIYGAKVELLKNPTLKPISWDKRNTTMTLDNRILDAPSGYNSANLTPSFQGGSGEHTVRMKFVSGNTILIGFA